MFYRINKRGHNAIKGRNAVRQLFLKGFQIQNISKNSAAVTKVFSLFPSSASGRSLFSLHILFIEDEDSFSQPLTLTWTAVPRENSSPTQYPLPEAQPEEKMLVVLLVDGSRHTLFNQTASS